APGELVDVAPGALLAAPPPPPPAPAARGARPEHPLLVEADRAIEAAATRERAVGLEYLPRLDLVAALFVRGSGHFPGGADRGEAQGLLPDTPNWAAGVTLSWPVLELFAVRARARVASARVALARALRTEVAHTISGQVVAARAVLEGALAVA